MTAAIHNYYAIFIVLAPALIFSGYVWCRTSGAISSDKILTGLSAGVGSVFLAILLGVPAMFFSFGQSPMAGALVSAFPGSGINEELAKAIICTHLVFRTKQFKQPGEVLLLCMLLGLGFSLFENVGYLSSSKEVIELAYLRALTATMLHLSLAVLMGAAAIYAIQTRNFSVFVAVIILQMALHGAYNFPLLYATALIKAKVSFSPGLLLTSEIVLIISIVLALIALNVLCLNQEQNRYYKLNNRFIFLGGVTLMVWSGMTAVLASDAPIKALFLV